MTRSFNTIVLSQSELLAEGIDLSALGGTCHKDRPYLIVTANRQMTWIVPLTTKCKGAHGRIPVTVRTATKQVDVEAICTDMYSVQTAVIERIARRHGTVISGGPEVLDQLCFGIMNGRLGVYANGSHRYDG